MHVFTTGDAAAQLSELMFTSERPTVDLGLNLVSAGRTYSCNPDGQSLLQL